MRYNEIITELTGYKKIISDLTSGKENLHQFIKNLGYKHISSGSFGHAYKHHSGYIIKVIRDDTCYYKFVEYCLKNANNPHLPKFKTKSLNKFDPSFFMVRMEELSKISADDLRIVGRLIERAISKDPKFGLPPNKNMHKFPEELEHIPEYKTFFDTLIDIDKNIPAMCSEDLSYSASNVMKRSERVFVVIDPWFQSKL